MIKLFNKKNSKIKVADSETTADATTEIPAVATTKAITESATETTAVTTAEVMSESKEVKQSAVLTVLWKILTNLAFVLPILFAISLQRVFALFPLFVEYFYSTKIYRWISTPISFITSLFPFSFTEMLLYAAVPIIMLLVIIFIRQMKKPENRKKTIIKDVKKIGWTLSILYFLFMILLGLNYARLPLNQTMGLTIKPRSAVELESVCYILLEKTNTLREDSKEKEGVMYLKNGISGALDNAYKGYNAVSGVYPMLSGNKIRAKGVLASHLWSYTGITGMYFPFFVEANVNIDIPQPFLPNTILHEMAHTRGIAREDEAGFIAFLTGIHHPDPDFKYSSYLDAFIQTSNALYSSDKKAYEELSSKISPAVIRDLNANGSYWKQFEGPVQKVSTSVNQAYLKSNMQKDGVKSYGRVVDLLLGYYLS